MTARTIFRASLIAMTLAAAPALAQDGSTVFAAASMKNALDAVNEACAADVGSKATISYAASSALAKQIEAGAPADMFVSADLDWMKYLSEKSLIKADTEVRLLGNEIVLVVPKDSTLNVAIAKDFDLAGAIGDGKLAMANTDAVPAGKYGKASLEALGVWDAVESKVAQAENVRAALKLVATGEAAAGIVYKTDAVAEPGVKVIDEFPGDTHPPIVYPVALTAASKSQDAADFEKCMQTEKAKAAFEAQGFTFLAPVVSN
jgi:molybdate transport system substrate-binding protein